MSSMGGSAPVDNRAKNIYAQIQREQKLMYDNIYKPLEGQLRTRLTDPNFTQGLVAKAGQYAQTAANTSAGISSRTQQRYGINPTARQSQALSRQRAISDSTTMADATNNTRQGAYALQTSGLSALNNFGNNKAGAALSNAGAMASLESRRNSKNQQIEAADQAGTMSAVGSAVGLGAAIAM